MNQAVLPQTRTRLGLLQIAIIALVVATALIHLTRGLLIGAPSLKPFPLLFYLNCIGYLALAAALYFVPAFLRFQQIVRWALIVYAAITIVAWFLLTGGRFNVLAYIDKPVEIALIILLLVDAWRSRMSNA